MGEGTTNQVLTLAADEFFNENTSFGDRGDWPDGIGGRSPSRWLTTENDHYVYGLTESGGVTLASSRPSIGFVTEPGLQKLSSNDSLTFNLQSDRRVRYEIRFDRAAGRRRRDHGTARATRRRNLRVEF